MPLLQVYKFMQKAQGSLGADFFVCLLSIVGTFHAVSKDSNKNYCVTERLSNSQIWLVTFWCPAWWATVYVKQILWARVLVPARQKKANFINKRCANWNHFLFPYLLLKCWIHFQECLGAITRCLTSKCQECLGVPPTSMGTVELTTCHERRLASQALLQRPCPCWASESDASCSTSEIGMEVTWCLLGVTPSVWRHGSVEKIQVQRKKINKHSVI